MAEILRLPQRRRAEAAISATPVPAEGKVLFFTGVRYQRTETPAPLPEPCGGKAGASRAKSRARRA